MFAKKQSLPHDDITSLSEPFKQLSLNSTHSHHQFFLLVRDQKYEQAYKLGQKILSQNPNNPSIEKFCDFIRNNAKGLAEMLEEQQYTDGSDEEYEYQDEDDEEDQDQEDSEEEEDEKSQPSSRSSSQSIASKVSSTSFLPKISSNKKVVSSKQVSNKELNKENAHKWDHTCKNPNCPNKNKPHKH